MFLWGLAITIEFASSKPSFNSVFVKSAALQAVCHWLRNRRVKQSWFTQAPDTPGDFIRSSRRLAKITTCTRFYDSEFRNQFWSLLQAIKNIWDVSHRRVCPQKTTRKFAGDFCWGSNSPPRVLNEAYINKRSFFPQTILAKSLGTLSQKPCKFAHSPSTPNAMLIWRALHTQNHCRRFQHCLGWEGGGQWPKQCDINRETHLRKAFFTNVQFCACFCWVSQGLLARIEGAGNIISPFIILLCFSAIVLYNSWDVWFSPRVYVLILKSTQKQNALMADLRIPTNEVQTEQNTKFTSGSRSSAEIHSMSSKVQTEHNTKLISGGKTSLESRRSFLMYGVDRSGLIVN